MFGAFHLGIFFSPKTLLNSPIMNIQLFTHKKQLDGTAYFELLPGQYQQKQWQDHRVFIDVDCATWERFNQQLLLLKNTIDQSQTMKELSSHLSYLYGDTESDFAAAFEQSKQDLSQLIKAVVQ